MTAASTRPRRAGRRASSTAASTGPPKRAPSRTALPPTAFGASQISVEAST